MAPPQAAESGAPVALLVHGSWHGAWCWDAFRERLEEQGIATHALDLYGHGERQKSEDVGKARFSQFVRDIDDERRRLKPSGPVVLIGHSLGGAVVQAYLKTRPQGVAAVVLIASVPPHGVFFSTLRFGKRHFGQLVKCPVTWDLYPVVETPELAEEALRSALAEDERKAFHALLQRESFWGYLATLRPDLARPGRVTCPVLVVGAQDDKLFARWEVERTAHCYGTEPHLFAGAHDLMLEPACRDMAHDILTWLREQGLAPPAPPVWRMPAC
jgi:pimeloyl-ACP methyl ester carboxylesterase